MRFLLIIIFSISQFSCELSTKQAREQGDLRQMLTHYRSGELLSETYYNAENKKEGVGKRFYRNGNVQMEAHYVNGSKEGEGKYYYQDGKLYRLNHYENDELHGEQIKYRPDGQIMSKQLYHEGHPGIHLEEFNKAGKKRIKYPPIKTEVLHDYPYKGQFSLQFRFENSHSKDAFYLGALKKGEFLHDGLKMLQMDNGIGIYTQKYPDDVDKIEFSFYIIGTKYTPYKNYYVVAHTLNYRL